MFFLLFFSSFLSVSSFLRIQSETRFCICYSLCYSLCHSHCYSLLSLLLIAVIATHCCHCYLICFTTIITINDRFYSLSESRQRRRRYRCQQKTKSSSLSLFSCVSLSLVCIIVITLVEFTCLFEFSLFKCFLEESRLETNCWNINYSRHAAEN